MQAFRFFAKYREVVCSLFCLVVAACALKPAPPPDATERATTPPRNPFLADSAYPIPHHNSAQVDSTTVRGPSMRTRSLREDEIEYAPVGPAHFGSLISGRYPGGQRVIWSSSHENVVKLDYDTFKVLATLSKTDRPPLTPSEANSVAQQLHAGTSGERLKFAISVVPRLLVPDLSSVYVLLDRDGNYYVGNEHGLTVYGDARPGDPSSPIAVRRTWQLPAEISGGLVGMNMTFDGWLVLATDAGQIVIVARDFSRYRSVWLLHSEEAAAYNERMAREGRRGYNWIRNSIAVDEMGGIYVAANGWMEKVVWTGDTLSIDAREGAWAEPYRNGTSTGTGSTPALMGFGNADRFVVITDGDPLMRVVLFWRDQIPAGWKPPAGALSPRVAGMLPVTMGDPTRTALQSEQAVVVAGYGAIVVNNEPASIPPGLPPSAKGLLISLLGDDPAYTPHGMEKFAWDPRTRQLRVAWTDTEVPSPNCVPYASLGSNVVYTIGARDGQWTLEGVDLATGASAFHLVVGGSRYNSMFSGVVIDDQGRVMYGGMFGIVRLQPTPR